MNNTMNDAKEQAQKCYENIKTLLEDQTEEGAEAIYETPLEVLVRSPWYSPYDNASPAEYQILLCTGGRRYGLQEGLKTVHQYPQILNIGIGFSLG